jgi:hypothetical protein
MGSLYLTDELQRSSLELGMADALIFGVPAGLGLEPMAVIGSGLFGAERESSGDVNDKIVRVGSCVLVVNVEPPDTHRAVDSCIMKPTILSLRLPTKVRNMMSFWM